jgi:VPDSG-CTERM motif
MLRLGVSVPVMPLPRRDARHLRVDVGDGLANQNFTLIIGGAGVPDGGSTVSLLSFGLLALAALRRKPSCEIRLRKKLSDKNQLRGKNENTNSTANRFYDHRAGHRHPLPWQH